jgi:hypothetical protein
MKKGVILAILRFVLLFVLVSMVPYGFAQNLQGTWQASVSGKETDWNWVTQKLNVQSTLYIYQDDSLDPSEPNLTIVTTDDPGDPFSGYVRDNKFWFVKHNTHADKYGGPNIGAEEIVGKVKIGKKGITLTGSGNGFDSNPDWGGSWSYTFTAKQLSSDVP